MNPQKLYCPYCGQQLECPESLKGRLVKCPLCSSRFVYGEAKDVQTQHISPGGHNASRGEQKRPVIEKTRPSQTHVVSWNVVLSAAILAIGAIVAATILSSKQGKRLPVDLRTISLLQEENGRLRRELDEANRAQGLIDVDKENQILDLQRENKRLKQELEETRKSLPSVDDLNRMLEVQQENERLKRELRKRGSSDALSDEELLKPDLPI